MKFGDVVFEGGNGVFSGAIQLAQHFLPGKDTRITHAMIVVGQGLALEAVPDRGVHLRKFEKAADLDDVLYVMRANTIALADKADKEVQERIYKAGSDAFVAFLGEDYSFKQILLHKLDTRLATEMPATLGATFCSGLVKRVLTLAGLTEGLSPTLLMSPSELHAELSTAAGWTPVSLEDFGRLMRGPTESNIELAKSLGIRTDLTEIGSRINEGNRVLIEVMEQIAATLDAGARATYALSQVNLLRNAEYPFDLIEEAGAAQRWGELGQLIGRVRWTIAASQDLYEAERAKLAHRLRSAVVRVAENMSTTTPDDPSRTLWNEFKTLSDKKDIEGLERFAKKIDPFLVPGATELYSGGRNALAEADDPVLQWLAKTIELRLHSINTIESTAGLLAHLLYGGPAAPEGTQD